MYSYKHQLIVNVVASLPETVRSTHLTCLWTNLIPLVSVPAQIREMHGEDGVSQG